jgi:hypothetical protein
LRQEKENQANKGYGLQENRDPFFFILHNTVVSIKSLA